MEIFFVGGLVGFIVWALMALWIIPGLAFILAIISLIIESGQKKRMTEEQKAAHAEQERLALRNAGYEYDENGFVRKIPRHRR